MITVILLPPFVVLSVIVTTPNPNCLWLRSGLKVGVTPFYQDHMETKNLHQSHWPGWEKAGELAD